MSETLILRCPCCGQNSVTATLADDPENATHATVAAEYDCDCMESGLVDPRKYLARLDRAALRALAVERAREGFKAACRREGMAYRDLRTGESWKPGKDV